MNLKNAVPSQRDLLRGHRLSNQIVRISGQVVTTQVNAIRDTCDVRDLYADTYTLTTLRHECRKHSMTWARIYFSVYYCSCEIVAQTCQNKPKSTFKYMLTSPHVERNVTEET